MGEKTGPLVIGVSPQGNVCTIENLPELEHERGGILIVVRVLLLRLSQRGSLKPDNLLLDFGEFGRVNPLLVPITADSFTRTGSDSLEHELGRIDISRDLGTVPLQIVNENLRVFSDITKVDSLSSSLEQEQAVERLEQQSVRLVDGTENLLSGGRKLSKETDQVVGGLTVKTRGGLVEEKQEIRLGSKFDTDGHTLSSFNGETVAAIVSRSR